jgi:hypothetical protein
MEGFQRAGLVLTSIYQSEVIAKRRTTDIDLTRAAGTATIRCTRCF